VNRLRERFTANRWAKRHSNDALMRLQVRDQPRGLQVHEACQA